MGRGAERARRLVDRAARRALGRLHPGHGVIVTEYPVSTRPLWGWGEPPNPHVGRILERSMPGVVELAGRLNQMADWCTTIPRTESTDGSLTWANPYWGTIDAVMQVNALKERSPATYLEVGSGYSTMFARRAISDFDLPTKIISVDPQPRADIDRLCDEVVRAPFDEVGEEALARLQPGDVFVFDGSHLATMGSDTARLFGCLDDIPEGVLVGIDDIFLPEDYHPTWGGRWYGENYLVAAWLLGGHRGWEIRLPTWHATDPERDVDLFAPLWPVVEAWGGARGKGFWIERTGADSRGG